MAGVERENRRGMAARETPAGAGARDEAIHREGLDPGAKKEGGHFDVPHHRGFSEMMLIIEEFTISAFHV